jgi:hypothetical protein
MCRTQAADKRKEKARNGPSRGEGEEKDFPLFFSWKLLE